MLREGELTADGEWHVAVARVTLPEIRMLAVQVQASQDNAMLEIADLRFVDQKPVVKLSDMFEIRSRLAGPSRRLANGGVASGQSAPARIWHGDWESKVGSPTSVSPRRACRFRCAAAATRCS